MNPLNSVRGAILTGFVLALALVLIFHAGSAAPALHFNELSLARWLHILSGVMWIGLLYYFNVAQIPALAAAGADPGGPGGAGITKYVAPRALFWFRWAALATWITGCWYLGSNKAFVSAATFGHFGEDLQGLILGTGAWLGTVMLFNVWVLIWPNQKRVLGIVSATDAEKAKARKTAMLVSRINFVLSIPMLMCMGAGAHVLLPY